MEILTRENGVIAVCGIVALAAFYALAVYTDVSDLVRWLVLIGVGVVVPTLINGRLTPRTRGS